MTSRRQLTGAAFLLALLVYGLTAAGHLHNVDMREDISVAQSMVSRGDFTINPNLPFVNVPFVTGLDGQKYSHHGLGDALVLLPAALVGEAQGCGDDPQLCPPAAQHAADSAASFVGPLFGAMTVTLVFLFALELGAQAGPALGLTLVFALGTSEWAYAHDTFDIVPTGFLLLLSVYALRRSGPNASARWVVVSGLAAALAVLMRLTSLVCLPVLLVYLAHLVRGQPRKKVVASLSRWGLPLVLCLALIGWYNNLRFGVPWESGYGLNPDPDAGKLTTPLLTGLAGLLVSPGKSMFVYSPPLLLALAGAPAFLRRHTAVGVTLGGMVVANLALSAKYADWSGDWAWGPRYAALLTGALALMALPVFEAWARLSVARRAGVLAVALAGAAVQLLDVTVEFAHQIQVLRDRGMDEHPFWVPTLSAIWRHAITLSRMLRGEDAYVYTYRFTDTSLGLPTQAVPDVWWVYGWYDPANRAIIAVVLVAGLVAIGLLTWRVWGLVRRG